MTFQVFLSPSYAGETRVPWETIISVCKTHPPDDQTVNVLCQWPPRFCDIWKVRKPTLKTKDIACLMDWRLLSKWRWNVVDNYKLQYRGLASFPGFPRLQLMTAYTTIQGQKCSCKLLVKPTLSNRVLVKRVLFVSIMSNFLCYCCGHTTCEQLWPSSSHRAWGQGYDLDTSSLYPMCMPQSSMTFLPPMETMIQLRPTSKTRNTHITCESTWSITTSTSQHSTLVLCHHGYDIASLLA